MNQSFSPPRLVTIDDSKLAELAPKAWSRILGLLAEDVPEQDYFLTVMAYLWNFDEEESTSIEFNTNWITPGSALITDEENGTFDQRLDEYYDAFAALRHEFEEKTRVGDSTLHLYMDFNDSENPDEDVVGPYFGVENCYKPTPAAAKLIDIGDITEHFFVSLK